MEKEEFVIKLRGYAPRTEDLKNLNFPENFSGWIQQRYYCLKREENRLHFFSKDVLLMLLKYYDCSKVEIGMISFDSDIQETQNYFKIGSVEQNILTLNKTSLGVEVLDFEDRSSIMWKCASNSSNFLEALLSCAEYFSSKLTNSYLQDNKNYTLERVNICVEKAGGDEYTDFYKMILGYFD